MIPAGREGKNFRPRIAGSIRDIPFRLIPDQGIAGNNVSTYLLDLKLQFAKKTLQKKHFLTLLVQCCANFNTINQIKELAIRGKKASREDPAAIEAPCSK